MGTLELIVTLGLAFLLIGALFAMVRTVRADRARRERRYNWQPEQDYDVEFDDGGPMTPPWPTMKKRGPARRHDVPDR